MELQVIRHKFARDYFEGFYSPDQVSIYAYQLQRMFESKAAVEGDYFLLKDSGRPYLRAEIYRTNTRRVWEKCFELASGFGNDFAKTDEALKLIFEFLSDSEYYFRPEEQLEISIDDEWTDKETVQSFLNKYGYKKFEELSLYKISLLENCDNFSVSESVELLSFSQIYPEERFRIVSECEIMEKYFSYLPADKLYKDYMDESYESEKLWSKLSSDGEYCGFIMPSFTSALKKELRLLNYCFKKDQKPLIEASIAEMFRIGKESDVAELSFVVSSKDVSFSKILKGMGAVKTNSIDRYIKK